MLRSTLFLETPNIWTISVTRQVPWQTNCAVNIRKERRSSSRWTNTGITPTKYVHCPSSRTMLTRVLTWVAPSGIRGNSACGTVPSSSQKQLIERGKVLFYSPLSQKGTVSTKIPELLSP